MTDRHSPQLQGRRDRRSTATRSSSRSTRERIAAYAAATNDPIAAHAAGDIAPPVFAVVPAFQADGMAAMSVIPGELLGAILHGEQDFHFHRPIEPGMTLSTTGDADRDAPALLGSHRRHPGARPATPAATWSSSST